MEAYTAEVSEVDREICVVVGSEGIGAGGRREAGGECEGWVRN